MALVLNGDGNVSGLIANTLTASNILSGTAGVLPALKDVNGSQLKTFNQYSGYTYLSNGLIIQYGQIGMDVYSKTWTFPIAFPTMCLGVWGSLYWGGGSAYMTLGSWPNASTTQITVQSTGTGINMFLLAIGY